MDGGSIHVTDSWEDDEIDNDVEIEIETQIEMRVLAEAYFGFSISQIVRSKLHEVATQSSVQLSKLQQFPNPLFTESTLTCGKTAQTTSRVLSDSTYRQAAALQSQ